jgi:hypothetical protein
LPGSRTGGSCAASNASSGVDVGAATSARMKLQDSLALSLDSPLRDNRSQRRSTAPSSSQYMRSDERQEQGAALQLEQQYEEKKIGDYCVDNMSRHYPDDVDNCDEIDGSSSPGQVWRMSADSQRWSESADAERPFTQSLGDRRHADCAESGGDGFQETSGRSVWSGGAGRRAQAIRVPSVISGLFFDNFYRFFVLELQVVRETRIITTTAAWKSLTLTLITMHRVSTTKHRRRPHRSSQSAARMGQVTVPLRVLYCRRRSDCRQDKEGLAAAPTRLIFSLLRHPPPCGLQQQHLRVTPPLLPFAPPSALTLHPLPLCRRTIASHRLLSTHRHRWRGLVVPCSCPATTLRCSRRRWMMVGGSKKNERRMKSKISWRWKRRTCSKSH